MLKKITSHNFTINFSGSLSENSIIDGISSIYAKSTKCIKCNMFASINLADKNLIHSMFDLTCDEYIMKEILE